MTAIRFGMLTILSACVVVFSVSPMGAALSIADRQLPLAAVEPRLSQYEEHVEGRESHMNERLLKESVQRELSGALMKRRVYHDQILDRIVPTWASRVHRMWSTARHFYAGRRATLEGASDKWTRRGYALASEIGTVNADQERWDGNETYLTSLFSRWVKLLVEQGVIQDQELTSHDEITAIVRQRPATDDESRRYDATVLGLNRKLGILAKEELDVLAEIRKVIKK